MGKKMLSVFLCAVLMFSLCSATLYVLADEEQTAQTSSDTKAAETITITVGVITEPGTNKTGVNMRDDAGTAGTVNKILLLQDGTNVIVNGTKEDIEGNTNPETEKPYLWYNVTYGAYTGYVREDMITVTTHTYTPPTEDEKPIVVKPFEEQLAEFPESYHSYLKALHEKYPNWVFTADNIDMTYQEAIAVESVFPRKLVENKYYSWRSMGQDYYNWNTGVYAVTDGRWYGASREVIAYYMDPRNFLNENDAYIFMKQSYDSSSQSISGVRELLKGRFMEYNYVDANDMLYGGDFAIVIMEAARQSGVNPYILASTIIQEQGTNGSKFSNGSLTYNGVTVYNFFNFGVSGTTEADKVASGTKYAYNAGWTTRSAAIIGGAKKYADGYVNSSPSNPYYNQDTYFYKNFNILNPKKIYHQYAQNVADQVSSAAILRKLYTNDTSTYLTFRIPVYKNNSLPETPPKAPVKDMNENNYYFNTIEVDGLTPSFSRYVYNYALEISEDTSVYVEIPSTASIITPMTYNLTKGQTAVTLTVKSATGYTNDYVINVNALANCVLTITTEKPTPPPPEGGDGENPEDTPPETTVKNGDVNGDGTITLADLAAIRLHLLELTTLTDDKFKAADTNHDNNITLSDLAAVRLHLLEIIVLK